jgi:molecular chaperone IbpA
MTNQLFDLEPLRFQTIGFDRLFENVLNTANKRAASPSYPPYNILRDPNDTNKYLIEMALAGFSKDEIEVFLEGDKLVITGQVEKEKDESHVIYRGIATRSFKRHFNIAEGVEIAGAEFKDGMLKVHLTRKEPETLSRKIEIS